MTQLFQHGSNRELKHSLRMTENGLPSVSPLPDLRLIALISLDGFGIQLSR